MQPANTYFGSPSQGPRSDTLHRPESRSRSGIQARLRPYKACPNTGERSATSDLMCASIRDRLGVITKALFAQRDFTDMTILDEFKDSLELSLRSQLTESGLYMGGCLWHVIFGRLSSSYVQVPVCTYLPSILPANEAKLPAGESLCTLSAKELWSFSKL